MGRRAYWAALTATAAGICAGAPAWAQGVNVISTRTSFREVLVLNPATTTTTSVNARSTQIIGRLAGGASLYDRTFAGAFADPLVQSGVGAARLAITNAGGPGVIIGEPVLTASSTTTASSSVTTYSLAGTRTSSATVTIFGPNTIAFGQLSTCNVAALPGTTRPTCQELPGTRYDVPNAETNFNVTQTTEYTIDQTTATTSTTTVSEQYTLPGIVRRVGSVHGLAPQAANDAADLFAARLRGAGRTRGLWLSGYGWRGERDADGDIPHDTRRGWGMTGGAALDLAPGLVGGVGFDVGWTRLRLPTVGESADIDLAQFGATLGWSGGGWFVRGVGAFGIGHAETVTAPTDIQINAAARNRIETLSLSGELGRDVALGNWTLTPSIGGQWQRIRSGAFSETGNFALVGAAESTGFTKGWLGLALRHQAGPVSLSAYGRVTVQGGGEIGIPVRFAGTTVDMILDGPEYGDFGGEVGLEAAVRLAPNATAFAAYDARLRESYTLHSASVGVSIGF